MRGVASKIFPNVVWISIGSGVRAETKSLVLLLTKVHVHRYRCSATGVIGYIVATGITPEAALLSMRRKLVRRAITAK